MPLSEPDSRNLIHQRQVEVRGYARDDGLWDIEGHLIDTKTYDIDNRHRTKIPAGEPIHEMWLRLTIDERLLIHRAEASTEYAPYAVCPEVTPEFTALEGLTIGPGFKRRVFERVGGRLGCTHLVELLGPIATTAFQTMAGRHFDRRNENIARQAPRFLNTCHALASDGPVVRDQWPELYTGPSDGQGAG